MKLEQSLQNLAKGYAQIEPQKDWRSEAKKDVLYFARTNIPVHQSAGQWMRLMPAVIALFVLMLLIPGSAVLAQSSMPGDFKYPIKRFWEEVHVALIIGKRGKLSVRENQMNMRLEELVYTFEKEDEKLQELAVSETQKLLEQVAFLSEENSDSMFTEVLGYLSNLEKTLEDKEQQKLSKLQDYILDQVDDDFGETEEVYDTVVQVSPSPELVVAILEPTSEPSIAPQSESKETSDSNSSDGANDEESTDFEFSANEDSDVTEENSDDETEGPNEKNGKNDKRSRKRSKRKPRPTRAPRNIKERRQL